MASIYKIDIYSDNRGKCEFGDYLLNLRKTAKTSKSARIKLSKIVAYLDALEKYGTYLGSPITKHLEGEIWELRPLYDRILYAYVDNNEFVILHYFVKKTKKTPKIELERAKNNLADYLVRKENRHDKLERTSQSTKPNK